MRNTCTTTTATAQTFTTTKPSVSVTCPSSSSSASFSSGMISTSATAKSNSQLHSNSMTAAAAASAAAESGYIQHDISSVADEDLMSKTSGGEGVRFHSFRDALNNNSNAALAQSPSLSLWSNDHATSSTTTHKSEDVFRIASRNNNNRDPMEGEATQQQQQQSRNESSQRSSSQHPDRLLFLSPSQDTNRKSGGGAPDLRLSVEDDSLDKRISSSLRLNNNQDLPLEGFSRPTSAATIGTGSFDHSDNHRTSEDAAIIGNHHHANTNIFRSHHHNPQRLYSPVIGTPTRASFLGSTIGGGGGRKRLDTDWTMFRTNSNELFLGGGGGDITNDSDAGAFSSLASSWIPSIRPSLSCPTSVFESPLFSSSSFNLASAGSHHSLFGIGGGGGGSSSSNTGGRGTFAADTILLSQPYRLEKIESISAGEPSPAHHHALDNSGDFLTDDDDDDDRKSNYDDKNVSSSSTNTKRNENSLLLGNNNSDEDSGGRRLGNELENVDVSVIECEDDENSPILNAVKTINLSQQQQHHHNPLLANKNSDLGGSNQMIVVNVNPMRNLSDAFESLVMDDNNNCNYSGDNSGHENTRQYLNDHDISSRVATSSISSQPQQKQTSDATATCHYATGDTTTTSLADATSENGETGLSTKPSPISVFLFENETIPNPSSSTSTALNEKEVTTHKLANGLKVFPISMPHFNLHDALRGNLRQGLIDRVSFYSIVRDINKEALDAALSDPKGDIYNDGTVHGKLQQINQGLMGIDDEGDSAVDNLVTDGSLKRVDDDAAAAAVHDTMAKNPSPPALANGTHQVIAEDGKIHHHPNPQEERESLLVMACLPDEQNAVKSSYGVEENSTMDQRHISNAGNTPKLALPSLGAALLDEEWWLMSAIASRSPEEVAVNQSTQLMATFYEAMGEKESSASAAEVNSASASSRTQLWKPGRSWWEAKSGKNPWVEPVVHNNRWRYLWPLIHYHKFMAKCIKKLKRNGVDVKTSRSDVSLFLREEVCNVSDHLAFMSKYDSEEWTSALSHFDGWTDHASNVEETLRTLVASQQLAGLTETADTQSSLVRSQIDDKILKAMQTAKDDAGKDKYDYKDIPHQHVDKKVDARKVAADEGGTEVSSQTHQHSAPDNSSFISSIKSEAWANESHLRSTIESKKRAGTAKNSSYRPEYPLRHSCLHQDAYPRHFQQHSSYGHPYGPTYGGSLNSSYYHPSDPHQYSGYGQYPPLPVYHMEYPHHGEVLCNDQYGHHSQYNNGYYHPADGSFHNGMAFDTSVHTQDHYIASPLAQTPNRMHNAQYPASPYWSHLNISQLPGISSSPSFHMPPRANHPNRSFRKRNHQQGNQQRKTDSVIDGKAKSLIMFTNQTNSPASRFAMSPQDKKSNPYYAAKNSHARNMASNIESDAAQSSSKLNHCAGPDESFVLPTIEDYSPESPEDKAHSNTSLDLMPPAVKKLYIGSFSKRQGETLIEL